MTNSLNLLYQLLSVLLISSTAFAEDATRTCRILFLEGPADAPKTLQLFDGKDSREVELPRMNLSRVYELPAGATKLWLLPAAPADASKIPATAPSVTVPAAMVDCYLLVSSDPANTVAPVRLQIINAGNDELKRGQMLWYNLTPYAVGGTLGTSKLAIPSNARAVVNAPARGHEDYPVSLSFRIAGDKRLYPLCETSWRHDPRSRNLIFILGAQGGRAPRVMGFTDFRDKEKKKEH
jgi:hypothetical protein